MAEFHDFNIEDDDIDFSDVPTVITPQQTAAAEGEVEVTLEDEEDKTVKESAPKTEASETSEEEPAGEDEEVVVTDDTFQKISESLVQMGIFQLEEGEEKLEIKDPEAFAERWQKSYQTAGQQFIQQTVGALGESYADAFNKIFVQGLDPYEYFGRTQEIETLENLDLSAESNQERVYANLLRSQGYSDEDVAAKVQKSKDYGDLEDDAQKAHKILLKRQEEDLNKAAIQRQAEIQAEAQAAQKYQASIGQTLQEAFKKKELDGIPVTTQKRMEDAYAFITQPRYTYNGQPITEMDRLMIELRNPANAAVAAKIALLALDGFKTDKVAKKAISDKSDKLFSNLTNKEKIKNRTEGAAQQDYFPFA